MRPSVAWLVSIVVVVAAIVATRGRGPDDAPETTAPAVPVDPVNASPRVDAAGVAAVAGEAAPASTLAVVAPEAAPRKFERRFMFDCSGDQFFVRIGDDEARLLPPGSLTGYYIPLAAAGGSTWRGRYANEDIVFRNEGVVGAFEIGEHKFENCAAIRDRAALAEAGNGVSFQAFGQTPAWNFEIVVPLGFVLTTDARQIQLPFREPTDGGGKITFRSVLGTQELVVVVDRIPCRDAPSGETFAHAVTVTFDGEWYYGCGRFIRFRDEPAANR